MQWIEVSVPTRSDEIDDVCAQLAELGAGGMVVEDETDFQQFLEQNHQYWDYVDDAYFKFAEVKDLIRELAETENCIYRLAYAIKKAQKRANALQNIVIPGLNAEISRISDALEEKEREEFVRLKVVKAREDH